MVYEQRLEHTSVKGKTNANDKMKQETGNITQIDEEEELPPGEA